MTITGTETREELAEAIGHLCHHAKRCTPKVGTEEHPTDWDRAHAKLDMVLHDLEALGSVEA